MKYILTPLLMILAACTGPEATEKIFPIMPDGLKDCKFYRLINNHHEAITVARCPLSATTVTIPFGKTVATSIIVEHGAK